MGNAAKRFWLIGGLLSVLLLPAPAGAGEDGAAGAAGAVLEASGFSSGLCLHLGCGREETPGLAAELAAQSGMPVHGLALDDAALARARAKIIAAGVSGRAMVEKLPGKSLPYLRHLARLIVVEDMAALNARGIDKEEVLRVLAPGGVLCVADGGKWTAEVKPRPKEMDEWTHAHHGPDGNLVSDDKVLSFPIGLRWIDGTPFGRGGFGSCAPCRAVVLAGDRCFAVSVDDPGNPGAEEQEAFLTARDAYSGMPLWKLNCQATYNKVQLDWRNAWPLVATDRRVYTRRKDELIIVEAASGKVEATCATKYQPRRLLLFDDTLITACWEKMELNNYKDGFENDRIRSVWWPAGEGSLEAFDPETGKPRWNLPLKALTIAASGKTVYVLTHEGNPPTKREVVAVDAASGKEKWRVPHTTFGQEPDTCLNFAGADCVVISKTKLVGKREVFVLNEADGKVRFRIPETSARNLVGDELWCSDGRYDLKTGQKVPGSGVEKTYAGRNLIGGCVPPVVVGGRYVTSSRRGNFLQLPEDPNGRPVKLAYAGARGACIMGMVPANGMFYTAQNNCACFGAQVGGFLAIGPCGDAPKAEDFTGPRPVEKGPAFGAVGPAPAADEWPTYRGNSERSGGTSAKVPEKLRQLWKVQCVKPSEGQFGIAWKSRIGAPQPLTAPIIAAGGVFITGVHTGEVMALDPATGAFKWKTALGSRIDSPPTYHQGLLLVGCHDGWAYALRAADGVLAYRLRLAPVERRLVAYGMVESAWPAAGAVLVHDGLAYAAAGRSTTTDGGIGIVAFKPETGETVWARRLGEEHTFLIDALSVRDGELAWNRLRMDPETGADLAQSQRFYKQFSMICGAWSAGYSKRSGRGFMLGSACSNMMAWNEKLVLPGTFAVERAKVEVPKPAPQANKPKHPDKIEREEMAWTTQLEPQTPWAKVNAMALAGNSAFYAGSQFTRLRSSMYAGSFLWVKSAADGTARGPALKLEARPAYDGLAVAGGRVFLALQDGSLVCWGE